MPARFRNDAAQCIGPIRAIEVYFALSRARLCRNARQNELRAATFRTSKFVLASSAGVLLIPAADVVEKREKKQISDCVCARCRPRKVFCSFDSRGSLLQSLKFIFPLVSEVLWYHTRQFFCFLRQTLQKRANK